MKPVSFDGVQSANVVISGSLSAGKTTLARGLWSEAGYSVISVREVLRTLAVEPLETRGALQRFGLTLESATRGAWLGEAVSVARAAGSMPLVVDSVRTADQVVAVREALSGEVTVHVHLVADRRELERRFLRRGDSGEAGANSLAAAQSHPIERQELALEQLADVVVDTTSLSQQGVLRHVLNQLGSPPLGPDRPGA